MDVMVTDSPISHATSPLSLRILSISHSNDFSIPIYTMAATTVTPPLFNHKPKVCFSFAAYSKDLISNLHHQSNVPIEPGLTQTELSSIESSFNFSFPPDLRSILREGLPIGQFFPNWRSSSYQQLDILINLPILGLCKEVYRRRFWHCRWGDRPVNDDEAVDLAKGFLKKCPVLVPVYRNCYIPTSPCLSGNPVFYVNGLDVKVCSYDVVGFFQQIDFKDGVVNMGGSTYPSFVLRPMKLGQFLRAPMWAATEARRIDFWTELVELRRGWWGRSDLGRCLEDVRLRLRDGGWKEDDVDEMMTMMIEINGGDDKKEKVNRKAVGWHVTELSRKLLRGGWSRGDVVESLGCLTNEDDMDDRTVEIEIGGGGDYLFDLEDSCVDNSQTQSATLRPVLEINTC